MYLCKGVPRVEKGEFVPLEALDVLDDEGEVGHRLQAQLRLQRVQHVLERGDCQHHRGCQHRRDCVRVKIIRVAFCAPYETCTFGGDYPDVGHNV